MLRAVFGLGIAAFAVPLLLATETPEPRPAAELPTIPRAEQHASSPAASALVPPLPLGESAFFAAARPGCGCFAWNDPHGSKVCKSGCEASQNPTLDLDAATFDRLLAEFRREDPLRGGPACDALLYYGPQTVALLTPERAATLPAGHRIVLRNELAKTHAAVLVRVVDEAGNIPIWLPTTVVPLDRRHAYQLAAAGIEAPESSGTVKRVGRYDLWTRM